MLSDQNDLDLNPIGAGGNYCRIKLGQVSLPGFTFRPQILDLTNVPKASYLSFEHIAKNCKKRHFQQQTSGEHNKQDEQATTNILSTGHIPAADTIY